MRYTDEELALMKNTFSENDELLVAIRKVFLQLPLQQFEKELIQGIAQHEEVITLLRKSILPEIDGDAPFNQVIDLWMTVETKDKEPESAYLQLVAREKLINYLEQQLKVLTGGAEKIKFSTLVDLSKPKDEVFTNMIMRNTLIHHIEMQLNTFSILAGQKNETVEQTRERLLKDSLK